MPLDYRRLRKKPVIFLRLTGITVSECEEICRRVQPLWEEAVEQKKRCAGRNRCLKTLGDRMMALLMYYRTYITHECIGDLFGLHHSNVCRLFKVLEPLMARTVPIKKDRTLTQEVILKLLADVTEHPIQRPQKAQRRKKTYSGKKKRHTMKVEIVLADSGKILSVFHAHPGRKHDFSIRKEEKPLFPRAEKGVDLGYQGLQKQTQHVLLPFKRRKHGPLTPEQTIYNRQQASFRIKVEHNIRELKVFRILSETSAKNFTCALLSLQA